MLLQTLAKIKEDEKNGILQSQYEVEIEIDLLTDDDFIQFENTVDIIIDNEGSDCIDSFDIEDGFINIYIKEYDDYNGDDRNEF